MGPSFADHGASVQIAFDQRRVYPGHVLTGTVTVTAGRQPLQGSSLDLVVSGREMAAWTFKSKKRGHDVQRYSHTINLAAPVPSAVMTTDDLVTIQEGQAFTTPFSFQVPLDALPSYDATVDYRTMSAVHFATVVLAPHVRGVKEPVEQRADFTVGTAIPAELQNTPKSTLTAFAIGPCHNLWSSCVCQMCCCCCCCYPHCCCCCTVDTVEVKMTRQQRALIPGMPLMLLFETKSDTRRLVGARYSVSSFAKLEDLRADQVGHVELNIIQETRIPFAPDITPDEDGVVRVSAETDVLVQRQFPYTVLKGQHTTNEPQLSVVLELDGGAEQTVTIPCSLADVVDPTDTAGFEADPQPLRTGPLPLRVPPGSAKPIAWLPQFPPLQPEGVQALPLQAPPPAVPAVKY